jgi:hypothetical protein
LINLTNRDNFELIVKNNPNVEYDKKNNKLIIFETNYEKRYI